MEQSLPELIQCRQCGTRNRVPRDKAGEEAKCGKCGSPLHMPTYLLRCTECGAKNRIPSDRIDADPVCGKCKQPLRTEELFESQPIAITEGNFENKVLKSPLPVLLFAWAPWCPTCRTFLPVIDDFAKDTKARIRAGKLNVDQSPALSSKYNILSVPQIFIFDNGELKENLPGSLQKHEIMMKVTPYL